MVLSYMPVTSTLDPHLYPLSGMQQQGQIKCSVGLSVYETSANTTHAVSQIMLYIKGNTYLSQLQILQSKSEAAVG